MRVKRHELRPPPLSCSSPLLTTSVRQTDKWRCATDVLVGGWREGVDQLGLMRSTPLTCSWTWTCEKITGPPIRLPVFHLPIQQLAQRNSAACGDLQGAVYCRPAALPASQSEPLFSQGCFIGKGLQSLPAINMDTLYLLCRQLWLWFNPTVRLNHS